MTPPNPRSVYGDLAAALVIVAIVGLILAGIVWLNYPFLARAIAFESSPIAWLQSSVLIAGAAMCLSLATLAEGNRKAFWSWSALGVLLVLAALDERFMFHETLARWMLYRFFGGDTARMGHTGTLPMLGYLLSGALSVAAVWRAARRARPWFVVAVLVGAVAIALDIAYDDIDHQVTEELLELAAETLFLCGLVTAFRNSRS